MLIAPQELRRKSQIRSALPGTSTISKWWREIDTAGGDLLVVINGNSFRKHIKRLDKESEQFLQNHIDDYYAQSSQPPDGEFCGLYPEQLTELAYVAAAIIKHSQGSPEPLYLLEANRRASMLFDADPTSTVQTVALTLGPGASNAHLLMQRWRLQNLTLNPDKHQIIAEVQGRWTGALYSRDFENPLGTPYAFLGRHRVVIKTGSKLHERCSALAEQKRLIKLADLIDDLQLHSQGFDPEAVRALI